MNAAEQDLHDATTRLSQSVAAEALVPRFEVMVGSAQRAVYSYNVPVQADGSYLLGVPGTIATISQVFVAGILQTPSLYTVRDGSIVPVAEFTGRVDLFGWAK